MNIEISDKNVQETICYLKSAVDMLCRYEKNTDNLVMCECITINNIIKQLEDK